ncbi:MAG: choice-of-anchor R domain-containing protein [Gammaproteobacteria bacterium]
MTKTWISRALFCALLIAPYTIANASTVVLYDTFGPNDYYSGKDSNSGFSADVGRKATASPYQQSVANGFTISSSLANITLDSIEVALGNPLNNIGGDVITMTLHEDNLGAPRRPGRAIESFDIVLPEPYSKDIYTVSSTLNPVLTAGQDYWLIASAPDPISQFGWAWNGLEPWGTYTGSQLLYRSNTNTWDDRSRNGQQAFRIIASATMVPLPASAMLLLSSILCLFRFKTAGRER